MTSPAQPTSSPRLVTCEEALVVGRYVLAAQLARGGLATVYLGRLLGEGGLRRTVAIKRLQQQFRTDDELSAMFIDEARLALRVRHPNVVHAVDVIVQDEELFIVMEYVEGVALGRLMSMIGARRGESVPHPIASAIICGVLHGLHAAHEAKDDRGTPLSIVHRDVSPSNVVVGADGIPRVLDFGVAKAVGQSHVTRDGVIKGKLAYMAPECVAGRPLTRCADIFSAGILLWELLAGRRLFYGSTEASLISRLINMQIQPPSTFAPTVPPEVDEIVLRALERDEDRRFATAEEMALALERALAPAGMREVGAWVREVGKEQIAKSAALVASVEGRSAAPSGIAFEPSPEPTETTVRSPQKRPLLSRIPRAVLASGMVVAVLIAAALAGRAFSKEGAGRVEVLVVPSAPSSDSSSSAPLGSPPPAAIEKAAAPPASAASSASGVRPRSPRLDAAPSASSPIYTRN